MKFFLLCLLTAFPAIVSAQIVDIPDPVLKDRIVSTNTENYIARDSDGNSMIVDANGDGEIQVSEALAVYELHVGGTPQVSDATGVQAFENLEVLSIGSANLTTLDVSGMENLKYLQAGNNTLAQLLITGCTSLDELDCGWSPIEELDLTGITTLTKLTIYDTEITALDLSGVTLTSLYFTGNPIVELDLSNQTSLQSFTVAYCYELVAVNMQNGIVNTINKDTFWNCASLMHICADEDEVETVYETVIQSPGISDDIVVTANCEATGGTEDHELDNTVKVYPNPTTGIVNITADSTLTSLQLFDLQGRLLQTVLPNDTNAVLDMTSRATGVYLLKVTSEKGIKVEKIVNE